MPFVKLTVTPGQLEQLKKLSGYEPLASYIKRVVLGSGVAELADARPGEELRKEASDRGRGGKARRNAPPIVGSSPTVATSDSRFCSHGVLKSEKNCWKCDLEKKR